MDLDSLRIETARLILRPTRAEDFEGWGQTREQWRQRGLRS